MGSDPKKSDIESTGFAWAWRELPGWLKWPVLVGYLFMALMTGIVSGYTSDWGCPYAGRDPLWAKVGGGTLSGALWPLTINPVLRQLLKGPQKG